MGEIKINEDKCKGCMLCVAACPKGLIKTSGKLNKRGIYVAEFPNKNASLCTGCAMCAIMCPDSAVEVWR